MSSMIAGHFRRALFLTVVVAGLGWSPASAQALPATFPPLEQWKSAIIAGDSAALTALYSVNPAAQVQANGVVGGADADVNFWLGLKAHNIKLEIVRLKERPGSEGVIVKVEVQTGLPDGRVMNVTDARAGKNRESSGGWWVYSEPMRLT